MRFKHPVFSIRPLDRGQAAFTMIEIALCLAIIGFALVAIIGVLPTGMGVQKDNREETIINQEAAMWMDTIRSGAMGHDDLTNYVLVITNFVRDYTIAGNTITPGLQHVYVYTRSNSLRDGAPMAVTPPRLWLEWGSNIVGLLSKPVLELPNPVAGNFRSNYIVAIVRAMSGAAADKSPQNDPDVLESAFTYRMIVENTPFAPFYQPAVDLSVTAGYTYEQLVYRTNLARIALNSEFNAHDLRLTFRWPMLPNGPGNGRQHFRVLNSGSMMVATNYNLSGLDLYFFQPSTYKAQNL